MALQRLGIGSSKIIPLSVPEQLKLSSLFFSRRRSTRNCNPKFDIWRPQCWVYRTPQRSTSFWRESSPGHWSDGIARGTARPRSVNVSTPADWTSFRTIEGLQQKAGVAKSKLRRLVLKELTDNGLDENAKVRIGELRMADTSSRTMGAELMAAQQRLPSASASPARWFRPSCCAYRHAALSGMACGSSPA